MGRKTAAIAAPGMTFEFVYRKGMLFYSQVKAAPRGADRPANDDEGTDLLDLAACYAFRTGGRVFAVPEASLPGKGPAAALLHPA
ncbi:MAG: hypothetical protein ACOCW6_05145 [Spirochaetota bacterium]